MDLMAIGCISFLLVNVPARRLQPFRVDIVCFECNVDDYQRQFMTSLRDCLKTASILLRNIAHFCLSKHSALRA
jgi:hypothetical protein